MLGEVNRPLTAEIVLAEEDGGLELVLGPDYILLYRVVAHLANLTHDGPGQVINLHMPLAGLQIPMTIAWPHTDSFSEQCGRLGLSAADYIKFANLMLGLNADKVGQGSGVQTLKTQ